MQLGIAFALSVPLASDRERSARGPGLRTFPLVAIGSCAVLLIGRSFLEDSESHTRLLCRLMTGIGFIGGGSIRTAAGGTALIGDAGFVPRRAEAGRRNLRRPASRFRVSPGRGNPQPAAHDASDSSMGTLSTGHGALRSVRSATLPRKT